MLSHKQEMERPHSEVKQQQLQSSRTCSVHNKALQTTDSASICTNNIMMGDFFLIITQVLLATQLNWIAIIIGYN